MARKYFLPLMLEDLKKHFTKSNILLTNGRPYSIQYGQYERKLDELTASYDQNRAVWEKTLEILESDEYGFVVEISSWVDEWDSFTEHATISLPDEKN